MIEPRIYRAAFVPALLAVVLTMFSFESRPGPLRQGLAADVLFDGNQAADLATRIATDQPDRRAGSPGDLATARVVADAFAARGFGGAGRRPVVQRFTSADKRMVNVVGRRAGSSPRQIVIVAARDAATVPDAPGTAADTAALMQIARVYQGRPSNKTLVLASIDGSHVGQAGARKLVDILPDPDLVDAVLVVSDLGARTNDGSLVQTWSNDSTRGGISLQRTLAESIRLELGGTGGGSSGVLGQLARLSFPIGIGAQSVLLENGYDAVRLSGSGELPPGGSGPPEAIDPDRLGGLGRATLRTLSALDQGPRPPHGPKSYVQAVSQVLPGWVLTLLAGALLLPVLVASVDAFARARRRQIDVLRWLSWLGVWVAPFLAALAVAQVLALFDATPAPPAAPVPPDDLPLDGPALAVLAGVLVAMVLAYFLARWLAARPDPALTDPPDLGAGVALGLTIAVGSLLLWLVNPYAGLLVVPAAHLWMLLALTRPLPNRRVRALLIAVGVAPALLVALYYMFALSLNPLSGVWYLLMLVTGHSVGILTSLIACLMLAAFCATLETALRWPDVQL